MSTTSKTTGSVPALQYLKLIEKRIKAAREDVPHFTALGEKMASALLKGGNLFTPPVAKWWPSEFGGRAGGLMGLKSPSYVPTSGNDVAYFTTPDPRFWKPREDKLFQSLLKSKAQLFLIGAPEDLLSAAPKNRFAGFTDGVSAHEGLFAADGIDPVAPLRPFSQFVRGWSVAGEMIAACTRAGKMPTIWMSVWLEGALARNACFVKHDNLREPWSAALFHDAIYIPPLEPGYVAGSFLQTVEQLHRLLVDQSDQLATAGEWIADALQAKRKVSVVAVGHSYPEILELERVKNYPLSWMPSISDLRFAHPADLREGDVILHLGYSPVQIDDVTKILRRGVKFIYTSPFGRPAALKDHRNLLWLDLPWRPGDATVDVPGYSVRVLPGSSSALDGVFRDPLRDRTAHGLVRQVEFSGRNISVHARCSQCQPRKFGRCRQKC